MSLPQFDVQGSLFESLGAIAPELFAEGDRYKLFAKKIWPVLASCREQLMECYDAESGRPGVEPTVLLGVLIFPVFGKGSRPASGGVSEVPSRVETGTEPEIE
jgi:hypothetical protein